MSIREYETLCQEYPENPQYSAQLAIVLHRLGHVLQWSSRGHLTAPLFQRSQEITSKLVTLDPENAELRRESAEIHRCLGQKLIKYDPARAGSLLRKAVTLARSRAQAETGDPLAQVRLANRLVWFHRILIEVDQQDEARDVLQEAMDGVRGVHNLITSDAPTDQRWLANVDLDLANALLERHEPSDSLDHAQQAADIYTKLEDRGQLAEAYILRGRAFGALGQSEKSASECERAIELDSESPRALVLLAICHAQRGQLESARTAYQKFIGLPEANDPQRQKLPVLRALAEHLLSGQHDDKEMAPEDN